MYNKSPILQRLPFGDANSGAAYDPFTLFIRYSNTGGYLVAPGLRYDSSDLSAELISDEVSSFHEEFHWLQHCGTTVGAFMHLLKYSQENTAIEALNRMEPNTKAEMLRSRFSSHPKPIIPFDESGPHWTQDKESIELFREIWFEHQFAYMMFDSYHLQSELPGPRNEILGDIIGDTILYFRQNCDYGPLIREQDVQATRKYFRVDEDEVQFCSLGGKPVTVRWMFESLTISNELQLRMARGVSQSEIDADLASKTQSNYYTPLRLFMAYLDEKKYADHNKLPTFNVICDLALNPPLPPLVMTPPATGGHWKWEDIFPPIRLMRLSQQINDIGLLPPLSDQATIISYIDSLCNVLGWQNPFSIPHPYPHCQKSLHLSEDKEMALEDLSDFDYYHYLVWVQYNMWEARKRYLPMFINPAECRTTEERWNDFYQFHQDNFLPRKYRWATPPFIWGADESWGFASGSVPFNQWLLQHSMAHYYLFDLIVDNNSIFDTSNYPKGVCTTQRLRVLQQNIETLIGGSFPKSVF